MQFKIYCSVLNSLRLLLSMALIATVASVPTSVLAQNSELSANAAQQLQQQKQHHQQQLQQQQNLNKLTNPINKVKRSSTGSNKNDNENPSPAALMNKKSSPEIVPASYTAPPKPKLQMPEQQQMQQLDSNENGNNMNPSNLEKNNNLINSAIAAGLTAAAVEAAAVAANQRELEHIRKQQQFYGADDADIDVEQLAAASGINKRGINSQQYRLPYGDSSNAGSLNSNSAGGSSYSNSPNAIYNTGYKSNIYSNNNQYDDVPQGVWGDDLVDSGNMAYSDLDEYNPPMSARDLPGYIELPCCLSDVPSQPYHKKAYDNLKNILKSESLNPMPYQRSGRYNNYNPALDEERNKKAYRILSQLANNFQDMRYKRDTKLTPADMLALVALVEAGERARKDTDADAGYAYPPESYVPKTYGMNSNFGAANAGGLYDYPSMQQFDDNMDYTNGPTMTGAGGIGEGGWYDLPQTQQQQLQQQQQQQQQQIYDYYGLPMSMEPLPKYEAIPSSQSSAGVRSSSPMGLANANYYQNNEGRFSNKRFMVAKKKRSIAKPITPYKPEKFF